VSDGSGDRSSGGVRVVRWNGGEAEFAEVCFQHPLYGDVTLEALGLLPPGAEEPSAGWEDLSQQVGEEAVRTPLGFASPEQELSRLMREVVSRLDTLLELGRTRSAPRRSAKPRKSRPAVVVDEFTMARARRRLEEMGLGGDDGST